LFAKRLIFLAISACLLAAGCAPLGPDAAQAQLASAPTTASTTQPTTPSATPLPTRPAYLPGTLVDYTVQPGDSLPQLAERFNTSVAEIHANNPSIPEQVTFLPPGMPMKIPIYYQPLWGSPYQILPDELYVNGPAQVGFNASEFLSGKPGWLRDYRGTAGTQIHSGGEIVEIVARDYSVSPRLLLALLEYQSQGVTHPNPPEGSDTQPLGFPTGNYSGLYLQLVWVANSLNNTYYDYRDGRVTTITHQDGTLERPDPWQNAATIALQVLYNRYRSGDAYTQAIGPDGLAATYKQLFGDPWIDRKPHIPGNLQQPNLQLPFEPGKTWAYTGGPHTGWGTGAPLAAIDFAPPSIQSGCVSSTEWVVAMADGVVVRAEDGLIMEDLDGDGNEQTGWDILYLHVVHDDRIAKGLVLHAGDHLGYPSCERGEATGTHAHLVRKYNGEWMEAGGTVPFTLEGWVAHAGTTAYQGTMTKNGKSITACVCSDHNTFIKRGD
jgi:LasA protease